MPTNGDPPRPRISSSARTYLLGCVWDTQQNRVENAQGSQVYAWLSQTATQPGLTAEVEWRAGPAADANSCVLAVISSSILDIVKNGSYDTSTGVISYQGNDFTFRFEAASGTTIMKEEAL